MSIKVTDGAEEEYRLTEHPAEDAGIETEDGTKMSAHAIVFYSEEAGTTEARPRMLGVPARV